MTNKRKHQRIAIDQNIDLFLYDRNKDSPLTGQVTASLLNLSKQGARLKFPQVFIDGKHLFYTALHSPTIFLSLVFRSVEGDPEKITTLLARPVWLDRDMEDSTMPFRMGVQFVD